MMAWLLTASEKLALIGECTACPDQDAGNAGSRALALGKCRVGRIEDLLSDVPRPPPRLRGHWEMGPRQVALANKGLLRS